MSRVKHKKKILDGLDAVVTVKGILTDSQALECQKIFYEWSESASGYKEGVRVRYQEKLYRCKTTHTLDNPNWTPAAATSLWTEILPGQDGTAVGEWQQPGSENGYKKGDRVTHNGKTWESIVEDAENGKGRNTWEPGVYGWVEVNE